MPDVKLKDKREIAVCKAKALGPAFKEFKANELASYFTEQKPTKPRREVRPLARCSHQPTDSCACPCAPCLSLDCPDTWGPAPLRGTRSLLLRDPIQR